MLARIMAKKRKKIESRDITGLKYFEQVIVGQGLQKNSRSSGWCSWYSVSI